MDASLINTKAPFWSSLHDGVAQISWSCVADEGWLYELCGRRSPVLAPCHVLALHELRRVYSLRIKESLRHL